MALIWGFSPTKSQATAGKAMRMVKKEKLNPWAKKPREAITAGVRAINQPTTKKYNSAGVRRVASGA